MELLKKLRFINSNGLKLLAAALMFVDHLGLLIFPDIAWLRVIGRFSMPLFAFMISEGCRYTRNKYKHFFLLFGVGVLCQLVYTIVDPNTIYLGILLTFSISTLIIYAMQYAKKCFFEQNAKLFKQIFSSMLFLSLVIGAYALTQFILVDYGFWGIMMPVFASLFDFRNISLPTDWNDLDCLPLRILCMLIAELLLIISIPNPPFQLPSILIFPLLLLYNGNKGKANLKHFFYIFYPVHLGLLQAVAYALYLFT